MTFTHLRQESGGRITIKWLTAVLMTSALIGFANVRSESQTGFAPPSGSELEGLYEAVFKPQTSDAHDSYLAIQGHDLTLSLMQRVKGSHTHLYSQWQNRVHTKGDYAIDIVEVSGATPSDGHSCAIVKLKMTEDNQATVQLSSEYENINGYWQMIKSWPSEPVPTP
jgi:hypothetical protein